MSACSAGLLTVEPVCGQTGCDHSEALEEDSPHHSPESRAKPAVVVELREAMSKEKKEEEHLEIWGWCFTHLEIWAENQVLRVSKSRTGAHTGSGRADGHVAMGGH